MRKLFFVLGTGLLFACNNSADSVGSASSKDSNTITYPYTATYSSQWEIGEPANAQSVLAVWKDFDKGDLSNSRSHFADSLTMIFADGTSFNGNADSGMAMIQQYRSQFTAVESTVHAVMPLKSTDKNEQWVAVWGLEKHTGKDGKVDSVNLQEVWRLNNQGKADLIYQFMATPAKH